MNVAVIGGGITGLVAARDLARRGATVTLLERTDRLGGKIETLDVRGVPVEAGPDWFLTRNPAALTLTTELGLDAELVEPARSGASILRSGRLVPLSASQVRGVPLHPFEAARAGLISRAAALRALVDLVLPGKVSGPDVSLGELVRRRLGGGVLDAMVDPVLAASRAGRAVDLSLAAAAPEIDEMARSRASLIRGLRARDERQKTRTHPPFLGLKTGMASLVRHLVADLEGVNVVTGIVVDEIVAREGGYEIRGEMVRGVDRVVLAVPAHAAARLVRGGSPRASRLLAGIPYSSAVVATLVYEPGSLPPPETGSGILVPTSEGFALTAAAWYSLKWEHSRPGDRSVLVRCFAGRANNDPVFNVDVVPDDQIGKRLVSEVNGVTGARRGPVETHLRRWPQALPQYEVGHNTKVDAIERILGSELPGVVVAGAGYRGSGLPDCISQAHEAARKVAGSLERQR